MKKSRGFTLVEIIVVMALLGVLSLIAISFSSSALFRSRNSRRITDMEQIRSALEAYRADHITTGYPDDAAFTLVDDEYMRKYPEAPQGMIYYYTKVNNFEYCLCSVMEGEPEDYPTSTCPIEPGYQYCIGN